MNTKELKKELKALLSIKEPDIIQQLRIMDIEQILNPVF